MKILGFGKANIEDIERYEEKNRLQIPRRLQAVSFGK